ncbi:MAG: PilZ domain-containing protein [Candidatus Omnitrophota bacterium]|nr:PilZ domain-containing protein [Candidatus Omnitrophota bacterium]
MGTKAGGEMENRRQFVRWQLNQEAKVQLEGKTAEADCNVLDLSFKGARIALKPKLATEKAVRLRLTLNPEFQLEAEVWVAWHKGAGNHNIYGLYFHRIKDADKEKIYKFICRYFPAQVKWRLRDGMGDIGEAAAQEEDKDSRIFGRFPVRLPLRYLSYDATLDGDAQTCDISAKGIGFTSKQQFPEGMALEVWVHVLDKGEPYYARAHVAWSRKVDENTFQTGVNLERVDLVGLAHALQEVKKA